MSDSAKAESLQAKEEGNVRMKAKDWKGAVESYSTAIKLDPANHLFYSNRCVAFLRLEQEDDALKDAQKCLELAPEWPKSYLRMAHVLSTKKQYEEAIDTCNKGLEFEKSNMQLKFMRGEAKKHKFVAKLLGRWHGSVPAELGKMMRLSMRGRDAKCECEFLQEAMTKSWTSRAIRRWWCTCLTRKWKRTCGSTQRRIRFIWICLCRMRELARKT